MADSRTVQFGDLLRQHRMAAGLTQDAEAERLRAAGAPQPRHRFGQAGAPWRFDMPVELTSFVGRESELARLTEQLPSVRVLTLGGPGGVGKTRLAARLGS